MVSGAHTERRTKESEGRTAVMADVAKLAEVSLQTVSRVLHDSPNVSDDTRKRVLKAIQQLNYRPNVAAQALVTGRSRTLGVVSFDTALYGPASTLLGIQEAAHDAGYAVSIASLRSMKRASLFEAVQRLRGQGVEGVVIIAPQKSAVEALRRLPPGVPMVAVEGGPDHSVPVVAVDQFGGAMAATRHLLELGHRAIWHIAGPADWLEAEQRADGWRAALKDAGIRPPALLRGDWSARSGYELGRQLLQKPEVTAVFVANDQMALGLLRRLHESGREAPRHLSIVGFDDIPEAAYFTPPLTTIRQDFAEVGRRCLHLLLGQLESPARPWEHVEVPAQFVLRESTAALQAR
ncbi:HTH-type transcriptional repressor [Stigmatella aurantiaca DW4/3-1]|uniref:ChaR3 protein n=2 Tax=Stigmatella aurantiaca TaxID=41 RepID=Q08PR7_STIAD|nr:LacI family DNA-binding transcriptional regulator [Stigmatella aurantiaca]ADO69726.1 HTH-type transcriptional repressor [Stigmatella aurantiaca DW4/3-1]EAU62478.1 ChaR3 protein [Stigmatella aurantiaca DW4/3-1]